MEKFVIIEVGSTNTTGCLYENDKKMLFDYINSLDEDNIFEAKSYCIFISSLLS